MANLNMNDCSEMEEGGDEVEGWIGENLYRGFLNRRLEREPEYDDTHYRERQVAPSFLGTVPVGTVRNLPGSSSGAYGIYISAIRCGFLFLFDCKSDFEAWSRFRPLKNIVIRTVPVVHYRTLYTGRYPVPT